MPLHIAVANGWLDCVQLLCEAGSVTELQLAEQIWIDTLIVEPSSGTVALHVGAGGIYTGLGHLASVYGHTAVLKASYKGLVKTEPCKGYKVLPRGLFPLVRDIRLESNKTLYIPLPIKQQRIQYIERKA